MLEVIIRNLKPIILKVFYCVVLILAILYSISGILQPPYCLVAVLLVTIAAIYSIWETIYIGVAEDMIDVNNNLQVIRWDGHNISQIIQFIYIDKASLDLEITAEEDLVAKGEFWNINANIGDYILRIRNNQYISCPKAEYEGFLDRLKVGDIIDK